MRPWLNWIEQQISNLWVAGSSPAGRAKIYRKNTKGFPMIIKKFDEEKDYDKVIQFLRDNYKENQNMLSWLPQRFDDLIYRIDTLYHDERGKERNKDFVYLFEDDDNNIIGTIFPDGDSIYTCIKNGHEYIFPSMLDLGEKELHPLYDKKEDGSIDFLIVSHDSLKYQAEELTRRGYKRDEIHDNDNVQHPLETNYIIELPKGFKQVFGEGLSDIRKMNTCHYGFHPADDDDNLDKDISLLSYNARKKSQFYKDSFESLIVTDDGDLCSYCFVYVDKVTNTAFFEPVCTREKYRKMGFATQMLHGAINRLKQMGIKSAYVNSYDWRVKVYNHAGFKTEETVSCWHKNIAVK